jgi:putative spermidine/putrescine transport system substrate-binding protein
VVLDVMAFMLTPEAQAYTYDKGYFYPGPAVRTCRCRWRRRKARTRSGIRAPEYDKWLAEFPHTQSLPPKAQVDAYRIWDEQIGAKKTK